MTSAFLSTKAFQVAQTLGDRPLRRRRTEVIVSREAKQLLGKDLHGPCSYAAVEAVR
jgi:hypothetical protein